MSAHVQATHGFTVNQQGGKFIFTYQQEKYRLKNLLPLFFTSFFLSLILLMFIQPSSFAAGFVLWLSLVFGLVFLAKFLLNINRTEKSFAIDEQAMHIDGRSYAKADVNSIYIQEGNSAPIADLRMNHAPIIAYRANAVGYMAASAHGVANGLASASNAAGERLRKNMAKLNSKVFVRYGNKNVLVAKGLTIDTAEVMMKKIIEVNDSYTQVVQPS